MLKQTPLLLLLLGSAFSQTYSVELQLDDIKRPAVKCTTEVPEDFSCAMLVYVDPPMDGIDIASVVGGEGNSPETRFAPVIREVSLILDGTLYTAVYDPPLKRDAKFSGLRRNVGIPARVDRDVLFIKWPDGKEAKAKIIRREHINPNQPQPA
jgi:hypothetical protein